MSMVARRAALRMLPRRGYATTSSELAETNWAKKQAELRAHAAQTANLWRKISFYVCLPGIAVVAAWVRNVEAEHAAHLEHIKAEHDGHLPELPEYEYLNRRAAGPFPWGMNSLFFNPHVNKNLETAEE